MVVWNIIVLSLHCISSPSQQQVNQSLVLRRSGQTEHSLVRGLTSVLRFPRDHRSHPELKYRDIFTALCGVVSLSQAAGYYVGVVAGKLARTDWSQSPGPACWRAGSWDLQYWVQTRPPPPPPPPVQPTPVSFLQTAFPLSPHTFTQSALQALPRYLEFRADIFIWWALVVGGALVTSHWEKSCLYQLNERGIFGKILVKFPALINQFHPIKWLPTVFHEFGNIPTCWVLRTSVESEEPIWPGVVSRGSELQGTIWQSDWTEEKS